MNAILYIRVSTLDQAIRGDQPEGFSIPAQREACKRKAKSLKAIVIDEYVDRGESARSADRPELQRMLSDLRNRKDIDYIIVHKVDRLARSLHDDVMIGLAIQRAGAQLVSVTEKIDETPSGRLLHGIMATIAEFYSRNLAAEALKGATQKAKRGGTPYRAPLGYINATRHINEREARTVIVDPDRAPLITWAFKRYATGDYSIKVLANELSERGFRNRRTGTSVSKPLSRSGLATMLHNRYYAGYVKYCGIEYRGRHKPLVSAAVFANVQAMCSSHRNYVLKSRKHPHYLLGTLVCGQCGRRMSFTQAVNRYGNVYPYFYCLSRQQRQECNQPYIPVALVEQVVARQFHATRLSAADQTALQREVRAQLRYDVQNGKAEVMRQEKRLGRLLMEQERILQAFYDDAVSSDMLGNEQRRIEQEIAQLQKVVDEATTARGRAQKSYTAALALATTLNLETAYMNAHPLLRRCLNQALFSQIRIDDTNAITVISKLGCRKEHDVRVLGVTLNTDINHQRLAQAVIGLTMDKADLDTI